jgi:hypothetical protein
MMLSSPPEHGDHGHYGTGGEGGGQEHLPGVTGGYESFARSFEGQAFTFGCPALDQPLGVLDVTHRAPPR